MAFHFKKQIIFIFILLVSKKNNLLFREEIFLSDLKMIPEIIESSQVFSPQEVEIAVDLAADRLSKGIRSGYHFLFADQSENTVGFTCFGPIPGTNGSFDIYWIAVHKECQGLGHGKKLLERTESLIKDMGGTRIYIETSSRNTYEGTRFFYLHMGYGEEAVLKDFYSPGDAKVIYVKKIR
jgi:ribosomal protein S18 acetylase RimI-like enzyme